MAAPRSDCGGPRPAVRSIAASPGTSRHAGLLERSDRLPTPASRRCMPSTAGTPQQGFSTPQPRTFSSGRRPEAARQSRMQADRVAMPPTTKRYRGAAQVSLPPAARGEFADVLLARRTWRRFSRTKDVTVQELATLLALSVGVQQWVDAKPRRLPSKRHHREAPGTPSNATSSCARCQDCLAASITTTPPDTSSSVCAAGSAMTEFGAITPQAAISPPPTSIFS